MVDGLIDITKQEQVMDDRKKVYCNRERMRLEKEMVRAKQDKMDTETQITAKTNEQKEVDTQIGMIGGQIREIKKEQLALSMTRRGEKVAHRNFLVQSFQTQEQLFKAIKMLQ